ncbi:hypothetical protein EW026_g328 [Hermanssonia centrifuga]|uniref:Uncharacterized protein n=1 Tax=Hermanssonia centrifuga TaxID=98765 RepID=A0A4S4KZM7_9APHY|nr:hypothetical protein EW026_g328 [Hermanssonia centrifuga]
MLNEGQQGCLEPAAGWQMLSTFLSPWKLAATSIELRFTMKQLGEALLRESSRDKASACLDNLTSNVFGQGMNSEEADFIAEMMKGVSTSVAGKLYGSGSTLDPLTFPLLIDTLHYLLDEYPPDPKATTFDIFHNYPHFELHSLPSDMPFDYRQKIRALLPYVAPNASVANLAYASKDALETNLTPVQNRPWEWTENLGDRLAPEANDDKADEQTAVRNSASLPLELFSARPTGERIISSSSTGFNSRVEGEMRTLQDASSSESALKRDWRETRVSPERAISGPPRKAEQEDEVGAMPTFNNSNNNSNNAKSPSEYRAASRVASPASSVRSRGSVQPPVSLRQSPASLLGLTRLSGSSVGEPIDVDSLDIPASTSTSHNREKRTNTTGGSMGSEDPDIVELSSHAAKKPKVRPAVAKPRTKKR